MKPFEERLPGIQLGRAAAALAVLYFHSNVALGYFDAAHLQTWSWLARRGALGVDLFFAISGFIVCHVAARDDFTAISFLVRRVGRIYPLNAAITLVMLVLFAHGFGGGTPSDIEPGRIVRSLLILPQQNPINAVGWTLEYEMAFYIVSAMLLPRGGSWLLLIYCACAAAAGILFQPQEPLVARFLSGYHANFGAGVAAYLLVLRLAHRNRWLSAGVLLAVAAALLWLAIRLPLSILISAACLPAVAGLALLPRTPRVAERLGDISYGIYLLHWPVLNIANWVAFSQVRPHAAAGEIWRWEAFLHVILLAWLSWTYFEQPINRWAARMLSRRDLRSRTDREAVAAKATDHRDLASGQPAAPRQHIDFERS